GALPGCRVVFDVPLPVMLPIGGGAAIPIATSTARGFTEFDCSDSKVVAPCDPNFITGPDGFGGEHWWNADRDMAYRVDFENLAGVGVAPAQVARITVPLGPGFDYASFRVGNAGFGGVTGKTIVVPPSRTAFD